MSKVALQLHKSKTMVGRWSSRWNWCERALEFDRYQARAINDKSVARLATQVARQLDYADTLDSKTKAWADALDPATLTPMEAAALSKVSIELKQRTFEAVDGAEVSFPAALPTPQFIVQIITPGCDKDGNPMVGVQLEVDGVQRCGYIPRHRIQDFKRDHPEGVVLA